MAEAQTGEREHVFAEAKKSLDAALARDELPSCALDEEGVAAQQARQARLAPSVTKLERFGDVVIFAFADGFDRQSLEEMVAVEEQCCPFFSFAFNEATRQLTVGVKHPEMQPALEAIASQLGAGTHGDGD